MKNIFVKLLTVIGIVALSVGATFAQNAFSYQAVVRAADGNVIADQKVGAKISLLDSENKVCYVETHETTTNGVGIISLMVGNGTVVSGSFAAVPWSSMKISMKLEVKTTGDYSQIGTFPINPVPYAMYAASAPREIVATSDNDDEPLFVVKNKAGEPVFAVYSNGVVVYIDEAEGSKAVKSGFAITKRTTGAKEETEDYFTVTPEGTKVYIDEAEDSKAVKSGFAITKRTPPTKGVETENYLQVDSDGTRIFVDADESDKAVKSGFAITKRTTGAKADDNNDLFVVNEMGTEVRIDDADDSKAVKSGFAIVSKKKPANKAAENYDYFTVTGDSTRIYVAKNFDVANKSTQQSMMSFANDTMKVATDLYVQGSVASEGELVANVGMKKYQNYAMQLSFDLNGNTDDARTVFYVCSENGMLETVTINERLNATNNIYVFNHKVGKVAKYVETVKDMQLVTRLEYVKKIQGDYGIKGVPAWFVENNTVAGYELSEEDYSLSEAGYSVGGVSLYTNSSIESEYSIMDNDVLLGFRNDTNLIPAILKLYGIESGINVVSLTLTYGDIPTLDYNRRFMTLEDVTEALSTDENLTDEGLTPNYEGYKSLENLPLSE